MIKKLILKNFQIHKHLEIDFKKFVTIIGSNDGGKSSVIRAINWLFYNEPLGDWMRRVVRDKVLTTTVKAVFEDGTIIKRIKGDNVNKYVVDGDEYENFGFQVPQPVLEKLRIYPFLTNKTSFNLHVAMQGESPFLLNESAPVKASVIDVLTGNSVIQKSISSFNKEFVQTGKEISSLEDGVANDKAELETMPDLNVVETKLKDVDRLDKDIESTQNFMDEISAALDLRNDWQKTINKKIPNLDSMKDKATKIQNLENEILKLKNNLEFKKSIEEDIKPIPQIGADVETMAGRLMKLELNIENLKFLIEEGTTAKKIIEISKKEIKKYENKVAKFKKRFKLCPFCARPM